MPSFGEFSTKEGTEKVMADNFYLAATEKAFIASGEEHAFALLRIDGNYRIDGKAIVGTLQVFGTLKVEGTVETEPIFE